MKQIVARGIQFVTRDAGDTLLLLVYLLVNYVTVLRNHHVSTLFVYMAMYALFYAAIWYIGHKIHPFWQRRGEQPRPFPWAYAIGHGLSGEAILLFLLIVLRIQGIPW